MLSRFSHFFACLLLVLIPLEGFAAASMVVQSSMMQSALVQEMFVKEAGVKQVNADTMPCHKGMQMAKADTQQTTSNKQTPCKHKSACKANCAAVCALSNMAALTKNSQLMSLADSSQVIDFNKAIYTSYTSPTLQRPPSFLS